MDQTLTSQIIETLIVLAIPVVVGLAAALTRVAIQLLRSRLTAQQFALLQEVVSNAVAAAEQTGLTLTAQQRKFEAVGRVRMALAGRGIDVDVSTLDSMIEAAVLREINFGTSPINRTGAAEPADLAFPDDDDDGGCPACAATAQDSGPECC